MRNHGRYTAFSGKYPADYLAQPELANLVQPYLVSYAKNWPFKYLLTPATTKTH